jgi:trk system potassium uptake protein TrkH
VLRRIFPILHVLGMIVLVFGLSMLAPLLLSELTRDGAERAYDEAVLITIGAGLAMWLRAITGGAS